MPSIILLQLDNLWKANSFLSVLQYWPVLKSGGVRDNLCRPIAEKVNFTKFCQKFKWNLKTWPKILFQESQNPNEYNSTFWKIKKIFYFSYWNNLMEITLPSLLPYPINTIRRLHLTLLTDCVLVDFPTKRKTCLLHQNSFKVTIFVDIITRNKSALQNSPANQPSPGCTVSLTQWPNMPMPCQHLMTHLLSKGCCKCVALWWLKLRKLQWCYRNLPMRLLATVKKIINYFIDRTIFNEPWKPISDPFTIEISIPCMVNSSSDHLDLTSCDTSSHISLITSLSHLYLFRLSSKTEYQKK